jgi:uncharacterized protein YozE (UPF0346 family)
MTVWQQTIRLGDVFHDESLTFDQRRDQIVERLRQSRWFKHRDAFDMLADLIEELAGTENESDFDEVWNSIYDEADADKVWIETVI